MAFQASFFGGPWHGAITSNDRGHGATGPGSAVRTRVPGLSGWEFRTMWDDVSGDDDDDDDVASMVIHLMTNG